MKLVLVEWVDSAELFGWQCRNSIPGVAQVTTVGFVSEETDTELTLITSVSQSQEKGCMSIPKCAIIRNRNLRIK